MAFFEEIGVVIGRAGQNTLQKTKSLTEAAKINSNLSDEQKKLSKLYVELGQQYYLLYRNNYDEKFSEIVTRIFEEEQKILEMQQQLEDIKGIQCCEKCGAKLQNGARFCNSCGYEVQNLKIEQTQKGIEMMACWKCGAIIESDSVFCEKCGAKIKKKEEDVLEDNKKQNDVHCPWCGNLLEFGASFCGECGKSI